jgi:hypothetical protein
MAKHDLTLDTGVGLNLIVTKLAIIVLIAGSQQVGGQGKN